MSCGSVGPIIEDRRNAGRAQNAAVASTNSEGSQPPMRTVHELRGGITPMNRHILRAYALRGHSLQRGSTGDRMFSCDRCSRASHFSVLLSYGGRGRCILLGLDSAWRTAMDGDE